MNEPEKFHAAVETVASNAKVSSGVAALAGTAGANAILSDVHTLLGIISLAIGCAVGLYVLWINHTKLKIYQRMLADGESLGD